MRKPYIRKYLLYDMYLSPQEHQTMGDGDKMTLVKGQSGKIGDYGVKFANFDMTNHGEGGDMQVGAVLEVTHGSQTSEVIPRMAFTQEGKQYIKADMPNGEGSITCFRMFKRMPVGDRCSSSGVPGMDVMDLLVLEVSKKPLINLVWIGVIMVCVEILISLVRRRRLQFS